MASRVRDLQRQNHDEGSVVWPGQEIADVATHFLVNGDEAQPEGTGDVRAEEDEDEEAALVDELVVEVDACQNRYRDEGAVWNLHEGGDERAEAEPFCTKSISYVQLCESFIQL